MRGNRLERKRRRQEAEKLATLSLSLPLLSFSPFVLPLSYLYWRGLDEATVLEPADEPRRQSEVFERGDGRRDIGGPATAMVFLIRAVREAVAAFFLASLLLHRCYSKESGERREDSMRAYNRSLFRLLLLKGESRNVAFSRLMPRRHVQRRKERKKWRKKKLNDSIYRLLQRKTKSSPTPPLRPARRSACPLARPSRFSGPRRRRRCQTTPAQTEAAAARTLGSTRPSSCRPLRRRASLPKT